MLKTPLLGLVGALALLLAGCGSGGGAANESAPVAEAPAPVAKPTGKLEVVAFKGGYGIDFYQQAAKEFEGRNPGLSIEVTGNPKVWESLRPRMVAGTPPDLMFPGWGMDHWALVDEGQVLALDRALDGPADDGKGTWRETFDPNVLKLGQKDGKTYMLPLYTMVYGWWYDPGLFAANGWTPPRTYAELLTLSEKIKAKGIAPITYQGQYPYYMIEGMLLPWAASVGGTSAIDAAQNLQPGAWNSPAMLRSAEMIVELRDKGFFQSGATGMSHTEAQTGFLNRKAAMIPCGSWLESEMKETMPKGAKVAFFLPPVVEGGKGDPTMTIVRVEPWMVPADAKNPDAAIAFYRYLTSLPKAKQFVQEKGTLMAIRGSDAGDLPESLRAPSQTVRAAKSLWSNRFRQWYPAFEKEIEGALTEMLNGGTAQRFVDRCEAAAEKTRQDDSIKKYKA